MRKRNALIGLAIVVVVAGWYAFRPERAFIDRTVNESLDAATTPARMSTPAETPQAMSTPGERPAAMSAPATAAAPMTLATGSFHSNAHETRGTAAVLDVGGGHRVLRLTNFATSNGPDVRVYLVAAPDVQDNETVKTAGFVELGALKGNIGDQNYQIPPTVDLGNYRTVTIWCKRFSVNFGSAPLAKS